MHQFLVPIFAPIVPRATVFGCAWLPFGLVIVIVVVVCDPKYIHIKINHLIDS
jgi:hypothetical protein